MFWVIDQRNLWGDYGRILISGSAERQSKQGPLLLHRTGPFLPPISFPWLKSGGSRVVVSEEFKRELEKEGFTDLRFEPAIHSRIIKLSWDEWDRNAEEPKRYPSGGEPESYIWDKPHDPKVAAKMPQAWELIPPCIPLRIDQVEDPDGGYLNQYLAWPDRQDYPDLFVSRPEYGELILGDSKREWFERKVGEWVKFCDMVLKKA